MDVCLHACLCIRFMPGALEARRKCWVPGNQILFLWKSIQCSSMLSHLCSHHSHAPFERGSYYVVLTGLKLAM